MQEELNRTQLEIIYELRQMNKQLMDGVISNLSQLLQESMARGNLMRPSIENNTETAMITELPNNPKDDKKKSKPVIKSNVQIKAGVSMIEEQKDVIKERQRKLKERREEAFTQEEIDSITNMSTPLRSNVNDAPHPHWVKIQTIRSL